MKESNSRAWATSRGIRVGPEEFAASARLRGLAGLDASADTAARLWQTPDAVERGAQIGFPIAADEFATFVDHMTVLDYSVKAQAAAEEAAPEALAGFWLDTTDGTIHMSFVTDNADRDERLTSDAWYGSRIVTHSGARYTYAYLQDVADKVAELRDDEGLARFGFAAAFPDAQRNVVVVKVEHPTDDAARAVAALAGVDEGALAVEFGIADEKDYVAALGGHAISSCSTGPYGYVNGPYGPAPYLSTAGHCLTALFRHAGGYPTGSTAGNNVYLTEQECDCSPADVQRMGLPAPYEWTTLVEGWSVNDFRLTSAATANTGADALAAWVCNSGAHTQGVNNCGTISDNYYNCGSHIQMRAANFSATTGDSGATVYGFVLFQSNVPLVGLIQGNCGGNNQYSWQAYARSYGGFAGWHLG